jgi:hypothetical protein
LLRGRRPTGGDCQSDNREEKEPCCLTLHSTSCHDTCDTHYSSGFNLVQRQLCIPGSSERSGHEWAQITQLQKVGSGGTRSPQAQHASVVTEVWQVTNHPIASDFFQRSASYFRLEKKVHLRSLGVRQTADEWRIWRIMTFARQAGIAVFLVTLTLWIQCAGIAVLIHWARASIERGVARLSSLHAAGLMIRFSILVIVLQFSQIFLWSLFYRWYCLPSWESS